MVGLRLNSLLLVLLLAVGGFAKSWKNIQAAKEFAKRDVVQVEKRADKSGFRYYNNDTARMYWILAEKWNEWS